MAGVCAATTGVAATEGVFRFESCVRTNDQGGSPFDVDVKSRGDGVKRARRRRRGDSVDVDEKSLAAVATSRDDGVSRQKKRTREKNRRARRAYAASCARFAPSTVT